jgi:hypothetical protein
MAEVEILSHNKHINSDSKKHRSFLAPLFAAGYGRRSVDPLAEDGVLMEVKRGVG